MPFSPSHSHGGTNRRIQLLLVALLSAAPLHSQTLRIGVWNIEKLSATAKRGFPELKGSKSLPPRTEAQLDDVAEYLRNEIKADVLMVSEVDADSPHSTPTRPLSSQLDRIASQLGPSWKYFLGRSGERLRLGLLFNTQKARLKKLVNLTASSFRVTGKDVLERDPFIAWIRALDGGVEKTDILLVGLHLKSSQTRYRNNRMAAVAKLVGDLLDEEVRTKLSLPGKREEPEVVILGDCNDSSFKSSRYRYMFDYLEGVGFRHLQPGSGAYPPTRVNGSQIDHIFVTRAVHKDLLVDGSFRSHTKPSSQRAAYRRTYSDHYPVTMDIKVGEDSDFALGEIASLPEGALRTERLALFADAMRAPAPEDVEPGLDPTLVEDEETEELVLEAEVIDSGFEGILGPFDEDSAPEAAVIPSVRVFTGDTVTATRSRPSATTSDGSPPHPALLGALNAVRNKVHKVLTSDAANDPTGSAARLRELFTTERGLLRLLHED